MQTSKKLLITVAGVAITLLITGLMALRHDAQTLLSKSEMDFKYEEVPVENFTGLDFSSHWIVKIRQGRINKVEVASETGSAVKPTIENVLGTLCFKVDSVDEQNAGRMFVKITVPSLRAIKAVGETEVDLRNFQSDSLSVFLENKAVFRGKNNKLDFSSFRTSGDAKLEFIDNEM